MVEKYKRITSIILMIIFLLICLFFADLWILPQKKVDDVIVSYSERTITSRGKFSRSGSTRHFSWNFYTQKGYQFSTENTFIDENEVAIEFTPIFKNVSRVKSKKQDYSNKLTSDLNGICFYLIVTLFITAVIGLLNLQFNKNLSENGFYNIILSASLLIFYLLYLSALFN